MQDIIVPPLNKEAAEIVHKNWQAVDEVPYQLGKVEKWLKSTPLFAVHLILKAK